MAKTKKPKPLTFQEWCDAFGHGARAEIQRRTGLRYQTIHDLYTGRRRAKADTARRIEKATEGVVEWTTLVG